MKSFNQEEVLLCCQKQRDFPSTLGLTYIHQRLRSCQLWIVQGCAPVPRCRKRAPH